MTTLDQTTEPLMLGIERRPAILVLIALTVIGALTGAVAGSAVMVVVFALVGALWAAGIVFVTGRLGRSWPRRLAWADGVLFGGIVCVGLAGGAGIMGQLLMTAALPGSPDFFTELIRGSIGLAEALPFYVFNSTVEWLLMPGLLLLNWRHPRLRRLLIAAFVVWYVHRAWTYLYFVPHITEWAEGDAPLTADQIDEAGRWVALSWIRSAMDLATMVLLLIAAFVRPSRT